MHTCLAQKGSDVNISIRQYVNISTNVPRTMWNAKLLKFKKTRDLLAFSNQRRIKPNPNSTAQRMWLLRARVPKTAKIAVKSYTHDNIIHIHTWICQAYLTASRDGCSPCHALQCNILVRHLRVKGGASQAEKKCPCWSCACQRH